MLKNKPGQVRSVAETANNKVDSAKELGTAIHAANLFAQAGKSGLGSIGAGKAGGLAAAAALAAAEGGEIAAEGGSSDMDKANKALAFMKGGAGGSINKKSRWGKAASTVVGPGMIRMLLAGLEGMEDAAAPEAALAIE